MAAYMKLEGLDGESKDAVQPEDDFVFHPLTQVDDYTTEEPFDMAPPEGETLFHPYVASEDKAVETVARSSGGEVDEQFDGRTETFAEGPVEPVDPEKELDDPQEPAGADAGGAGNDTLIGGRGNDLAAVEDGAAADGGGTSTGTDGGSCEPGEPGGGSGGGSGTSPVLMVIANQDFWYEEDYDYAPAGDPAIALETAEDAAPADDDEFVFVRWSASEDKAIGGDGAASGEVNEADYHIVLWDIIDGIVPADDGAFADAGDPYAGGEIVICDDIGGMTLCDVL